MVMQKATMTNEWRAELTQAIWSVWKREGQQAALRLLALVGAVYGDDEEERIATDVMCGCPAGGWVR